MDASCPAVGCDVVAEHDERIAAVQRMFCDNVLQLFPRNRLNDFRVFPFQNAAYFFEQGFGNQVFLAVHFYDNIVDLRIDGNAEV